MVTQLDPTTHNLANPEAEVLILGGILFDPRAIARVAQILTPENFYVPSHQKIYRVALELHREGSPTDLMCMMARLEEGGILEQVGGLSYLALLIERTVSAANIHRYAAIVTYHAERRELRELLVTLNELINDRNYSPFELQELLIQKATALSATVVKRSPVKLAIAQIKQILQRTELTPLQQKIKLEELRQEFKIHPIPWKNDYLQPAKQELAANNIIPLADQSSNELLTLVDEIIDQQLPQSEVELQLRSLAQISNYQLYDLRKLYQEKCDERELHLEQLELAATLPQLIRLHTHRLDITKILPAELALPLLNTASAMPTPVEAMFTHILPVWSAAVGTAARIIVKYSSKYIQPCILRTMVVATSGDRKSPTLDNATEALEDLEDEAYSAYKQALTQYEEELERWSKSKKDKRGPKPVEPVCKRFVIRDVNYEGSIRLHEENPRGLLNKVDELAGYFKRMNKFRNGHGDDDTLDLTLFGGKTFSKDRKGESTYLRRTAISATGTIQWDALAELQAKYSDADYTGALARWLVCATEFPPPYLNLFDDGEDFGLTEINRELIQWLRSLPEQDYVLSTGAKRIFQKWQHQLVKKMKSEQIKALEIAYPKFESYCVRVALVLHLIWGKHRGCLEHIINEDTMKRAIYLINWYIGQLRFVLAKNSPSLAGEGNALIVKELLAKKTVLTLRDVKRGSRRLKDLNDGQLKSIFRALVEAGLANYVPSSKTLKIRCVEETGTSVNEKEIVPNSNNSNPLSDSSVIPDIEELTEIESPLSPPDKECIEIGDTESENIQSVADISLQSEEEKSQSEELEFSPRRSLTVTARACDDAPKAAPQQPNLPSVDSKETQTQGKQSIETNDDPLTVDDACDGKTPEPTPLPDCENLVSHDSCDTTAQENNSLKIGERVIDDGD